MSLLDDQNKLREENIVFLGNHAIIWFNDQFIKLENEYQNKIRSNVINEDDSVEIIEYLKTEFHILKGYNLSNFNSVEIKNKKFVFSKEEILSQCIQNQLVDSIYPVIEIQLKDGWDNRFMSWIKRLDYTTRKVYIKYLIKNAQRLDKLEYNNLVFLNYESEQFLNHLIEFWIKKEANKKTAISYIFWQMWFKEKDPEFPYTIHCSTTSFAKYWNENFKSLFELDQKDPKFKKHITTSKYETLFNDNLRDFTKK